MAHDPQNAKARLQSFADALAGRSWSTKFWGEWTNEERLEYDAICRRDDAHDPEARRILNAYLDWMMHAPVDVSGDLADILGGRSA